jgi:hypothetical protein
MKWMQVLWSSGSDDDLVRSYSNLSFSQLRICLGNQLHYLDIRRRDVAHHVEMVIYHSNGRDAFAVHDLQGFTKLLVTTESLSDMPPDAKQTQAGTLT